MKESLRRYRPFAIPSQNQIANTPLSIDKVMNNNLFDFQHRPFAATPDVDNYVPNESIETSIDSISHCVQRAAGPAMVIGPAGIGKSMLCVELANRLRQHYEIVLLANSRLCTRRALLQNILFELGLHFRDREEGELRLGILEHLKSDHATSRGMLLIVDEAHTMPLRLLEEIRGLTNIHRQGESRVHLVLAGTQRLDERLNHPKMEAITQRIATRCYLHPLNGEETQSYITQQWSHAVSNGTPLPFTPPAIEAIYSATAGIPRLINQLCNHTLFLANGLGLTTFSEELIGEAWSDLQQLPTPWQVNHRDAGSDSSNTQTIVEFGTLSDEPANEEQLYEDLQLTPLPETDSDHFQDVDLANSSSDNLNTNAIELDFAAESTTDLLGSEPNPSANIEDTPTMVSELSESGTDSSTIPVENVMKNSGTEPEMTFAPMDAENPFESDDFEEEELISKQRNADGVTATKAHDTTIPVQTEEFLGFAESAQDDELGQVNEEAHAKISETSHPEPEKETPEQSHLASDFSFFLSQPPEDSLEESIDAIEDSLTESIDALAEDLTVGLGPAAHEPETSHSKTTLDDILSQLKMESATRETLAQDSKTNDWDLELARLEQQTLAQADEEVLGKSDEEVTGDVRHADLSEATGSSTSPATDGIEATKQPLETFDVGHGSEGIPASENAGTESFETELRNPTEPSNSIIIEDSEDSSMTESAVSKEVQSESASADDKDMIVVDNPVPPNPLRIIGAQTQEETQGDSAPESVAFREDYQKLMQRLRGSMKS